MSESPPIYHDDDTAHYDQMARYERSLKKQSYITLTVENLTQMAIELYEALEYRDRCTDCGGTGTTWSLINEEPEPDACSCSIEADTVLERYKAAIDSMRNTEQDNRDWYRQRGNEDMRE